jgi:hypothetical protein
MARKPSPPVHIHLHLHAGFEKSGEVHLHLHPDGQEALKAQGGIIEAEAVTIPAVGHPWPVRPDGMLSSPVGFVCIYGFSDAVNRDEVWGKVFDHVPTAAEKATIPADAVQGTLFIPNGGLDFKFDHLTNELGNVLHSSVGVSNWIVVWIKDNGSIIRTFETSFLGVTATQTFCQLLSGGGAFVAAAPAGAKAGRREVAFDEKGWKAMIKKGGTVASEVPGA